MAHTNHIINQVSKNDLGDLDNQMESYFVTYTNDVRIKDKLTSIQNNDPNLLKLFGFVERHKITNWGRIHLDFTPKKNLGWNNGYICSLEGEFKNFSFLEVQVSVTPNESIWVLDKYGKRIVEGRLRKGVRYTINLWGYFK